LVKTGARLIPLALERGGKIGGVAMLSDEDCATEAGGGFGDSRQLEGEVGRVRHCSEEGDGGPRAICYATAACGGEKEECETEAVVSGKERDGVAVTYRRRWRRSRIRAVGCQRLWTTQSGVGAYIPMRGDNATDRRAPHVSGFKISINSKINHSRGKNIQERRKNLENFVEVGIPVWSNFCY
jgi:hypothetical protein